MIYTYDLSDFKRFLNNHNPKYRVDGLIFWQNRIPLPIDLFNRMFNESDFFLEVYLDHVMASVISFENMEEIFGSNISFSELPTDTLNTASSIVSDAFSSIIQGCGHYKRTASRFADLLSFDDYQLNSVRLTNAVRHQGKKYARLFLPSPFREIFTNLHPGILAQIACDNTDMFGNIVADHYNIYRSGFSDALAIIFNLLLDFRIACTNNKSSIQRISIHVEQSDNFNIELKRTNDGSLWEPDYTDDHVLRINPEHPFFKAATDAGSTLMLNEILYSLSKFENSQFSDTQRKLLENMRQEISRELWIKHDN
jgi:hypothetical protein